MTKTLSPCVFAWDGITDPLAPKSTPVERCENCGLPKSHPRHELPPTPPDAVESENRRYGDH